MKSVLYHDRNEIDFLWFRSETGEIGINTKKGFLTK